MEIPSMDSQVLFEIGGEVMHSALLYAILALVFLEFVTGMGKAFITGTYSSAIGLSGTIKHTMILLLIIFIKFFAHLFGYEAVAHTITIIIGVNYFISIIENLDASGVYFPAFVKKRLLQLREEMDNEFVIQESDDIVIRKNNDKKGVNR